MSIKLGVIGTSDGNGHPYSWSAIFNGYDSAKMQDCDFPVIPEYLAKQPWPQSRIQDARVTHVWTQFNHVSKKIADASLIENIVNHPEDMIGNIDALLLARDDAENHLDIAAPFLEAGIPIYIDKPIALNIQMLDEIYSREKYPGQIFTCSALRYSHELKMTDPIRKKIGEIKEIHAITPKTWDKYSPHIIEPVLLMLESTDSIKEANKSAHPLDRSTLSVEWNSGIVTRFFTLGNDTKAPISIRIFGRDEWIDLTFTDTFNAFRSALLDFIDGIKTRSEKSERRFNEMVVSLISAGR